MKMAMSEKLNSSSLDEDRIWQDAVRFRAAAGFETALRDYTSALVGFRKDPRVVNKLISHDARFRVINHLLFIHAEKVLAGGEGGVTYSQMLELCAQYPHIGLRVLKTMLPMLVFTGFANVARDPLDRRAKIYMPSAKLFAIVRARLAPIVAALQVLQPEVPRAALLRDDPLFLMRAVFLNGLSQMEGRTQFDRAPEFVAFAGGREGAAQVVYAVMMMDMGAARLQSRAAIAKQFGLSKTQVWSVFAEGERLGYFTDDGGAVPVPTAKLRDHYRDWTAVELAFSASVLAPG